MINIEELVEFFRECHAAMDFDSIGYTFEDASVVFAILQAEKNGILIVKEEAGEIVGAFAAHLYPHPWDFTKPGYQEVAWHAKPTLSPRKTFEVMHYLAKEAIKAAGDIPLNINIDSRYPSLGKMLERGGFREISKVYRRN